jgi:hypothetical protein
MALAMPTTHTSKEKTPAVHAFADALKPPAGRGGLPLRLE